VDLRDHPPADFGVQPEALGVALVQIGSRLVRLFFGEIAAGQVRVEAGEVRLPTGRVLGAERAVVEDMREGQQAALALGP
jgi:hypothetical protein